MKNKIAMDSPDLPKAFHKTVEARIVCNSPELPQSILKGHKKGK